MSSSIKNQTIDGYIDEFAKTHNKTPLEAAQTSLVSSFMESADERDTDIYKKEKERKINGIY